MPAQSSTEKFINKANKIHNFKYTYEKVIYLKTGLAVIITCPQHGDFLQRPQNHMQEKGCIACGKDLKKVKLTKTTKSFIEKAKQKHNNFYNYSEVVYVNMESKVKIFSITTN
jgi:hypothetical protein